MKKHLVVVSDQHIGCKLGLCPPRGVRLDDGGRYVPSAAQKRVYKMWDYFWMKTVPDVCGKRGFTLVLNGDAIDGTHHGATTPITHNLTVQIDMAKDLLGPYTERANALYMVRGTEAHVGKSGALEEALAISLGAELAEDGRHAGYEWWFDLGGMTVNVMHHISCTGTAAYETTALMREITNANTESARWGEQAPDILIRSHRHRHSEIKLPCARGDAVAFTTAAWQLKTPFVYRTGMKFSPVQLGGSIVTVENGKTYTHHETWTIGRPEAIKL